MAEYHHHEMKIEESGHAPVKITGGGLYNNSRPKWSEEENASEEFEEKLTLSELTAPYTPSSSPTSAISVIEVEEMKEKMAGEEEKVVEDTTEVAVEVVYSETSDQSTIDEDKRGLVDNVKEKLPGEGVGMEEKEKKGFLEKIKDKIPGFHSN